VILVDVNLLIHARDSVSRHHDLARRWLDDRLSGSAPVGLPWPSLLGFMRLTTNPRVFRNALTTTDAWRQVVDWLSAEPVWIPQPSDRHAEILGGLLARPGVHGNLVPDAHLAALAIEHGLILCSTDGDFARFPALRFQNPLAA
jgi:toxin-antitoxin system PIN domain toxin